ncbi:MAG: hypothetical protein GY710_23325 [Desulfobacteraceae bacterium]|nr:hypothetical protein [Desulfobacteraceae bacterium]
MIKKNDRKSMGNTRIKVLSFFLNQELYAISMTDIFEVNRMPVTTVKTLKDSIMMGVLNLHGSATCILNLKQIMGSEPFSLSATPGWIAVKNHTSFVCLAVDAFFKFMEIPVCNLGRVPVLKAQQDSGKIQFYARVDNVLIPILDIQYILQLFQDNKLDTDEIGLIS